MVRTLLGIDLKILPKDLRIGIKPWEQAKIIEVNGWNTGLTVLESEEFVPFLDALNLDANKTLLIRYQSPLDNRISWANDFADKIDKVLGLRYPFTQVTDWLDDLPKVYQHRRATQLDLSELDMDRNFREIANAANYRGIKTVMGPDCSFTPNGVRLHPPRKEARFADIASQRHANYQPTPDFLAWDQIEFVMGASPEIMVGFAEAENLSLNLPIEETIIENKALLYDLDTLFPELELSLRKFQPPTAFWGCGLGEQSDLHSWVAHQSRSLFVQKPIAGTQGVGVRFLSSDKLLSRIGHHVEQGHAESAYTNLIVDLICGKADIEDRSALVQAFVPSEPISYKGKPYDGCARSIVVCGKTISSKWRCGISPLDSNAPLEEKYRASLSQGSPMEVMSNEHKEIACLISEAFDEEFHKACTLLNEKLENLSFELFADEKFYSPSERLKILVYLKRLKHSARKHLDLAAVIRKRITKPLADRLLEVMASL